MNNNTIKIGVMKETFNKWERRIVITPEDMSEIQNNENIEFIVQPSNSRFFKDNEFIKRGIKLQEDLTECSTILGVKQINNDKIEENKTYLFFSHTIKAQAENMPLLDKMLEKKVRFIDYEKISDENNNRLVAFGKFAGISGCIDVLSGIGEFLLNKGFSTPFLNISPSYFYFGYEDAFERIKKVGDMIYENKIPKEFCPFIIGITSKGRCSEGVLEVLKLFKTYKVVEPEELEDIYKNKKDDNETIYITRFEDRHYVKNKSNIDFNKLNYRKNPSNFEPIFSQKYLPFVNILFNCMYWDDRYPRIITKNEMMDLNNKNKLRLLGVGDITSDFKGSIEMNEIITIIEKPFFIYDPVSNKIIENYKKEKNGVLYCSVDNLPSQFPKGASKLFSKNLKKFIVDIAKSNFINLKLEDQHLPKEIEKAVICCNGELTSKFTYISKIRKINEEKEKKLLDENQNKEFRNYETFVFKGHILDKLIFNQIMDFTTLSSSIYPKIIHWDVGHGFDTESAVTIKIFYNDCNLYKNVKVMINNLCLKEKIAVEELKDHN